MLTVKTLKDLSAYESYPVYVSSHKHSYIEGYFRINKPLTGLVAPIFIADHNNHGLIFDIGYDNAPSIVLGDLLEYIDKNSLSSVTKLLLWVSDTFDTYHLERVYLYNQQIILL